MDGPYFTMLLHHSNPNSSIFSQDQTKVNMKEWLHKSEDKHLLFKMVSFLDNMVEKVWFIQCCLAVFLGWQNLCLCEGSVTPVKAEEKTFRFVFCVGFWSIPRAISNSHQRTSTGGLRWQNSILRSEYPKWDERLWRWNGRKIVQ